MSWPKKNCEPMTRVAVNANGALMQRERKSHFTHDKNRTEVA